VQGWRVIFFAMAGVAALATVAVVFGGVEPRNLKPKEVVEQSGQRLGPLRALRAGSMIILKSTWVVFRIRSFQVILAAGIVGEDPQGYLESTESTTLLSSQIPALPKPSEASVPRYSVAERLCLLQHERGIEYIEYKRMQKRVLSLLQVA
jgi:hypothetical protein